MNFDPKIVQKALMTAKMLSHQVRQPKPLYASKGGAVDINPNYEQNLAKHMEGSHPETFNEDGTPKVLYHGTTADVKSYNPHKARIENDMGAGFYATNSKKDVSHNYAGEGPDLTARIQKHLEREGEDYDSSDERSELERREDAKRDLGVEHGGATMPVYISMKNPFVIGSHKQTNLDYKRLEKSTWYGEPTGALVKYIDAMRKAANEFDVYHKTIDELEAKLHDRGLDYGSIDADTLSAIVKNHFSNEQDPETGDMAGSEIFRKSLEYAGHDGIIDHTVDSKFGSNKRGFGGAKIPGMVGVTPDTTHYIAFHPHQIKSAIGNNGDFAPGAPLHRETGGEVEKHVEDFLWSANHQQNHLNSFLDEGEPDLPHLHSVDDVMSADPTVKQLAFGSLEPHLLEKETPILHSIVKKHGLTASPMDRKGHYWHVEDPQTLTGTTIRWMKDHQQQRGGGFNPHSGERSGDSDIDVHYDPDGILNVHSSEMHPKFSNIANDLHAHYHGKNVMDVLKVPHKAIGGEVGSTVDENGVPDFTPPKLRGTQIMKEPGGQWLSGGAERYLEPLKAKVAGVLPEKVLSDNPDTLPHHIVQQAHRTKAVNDFVGKQLTRYVKNDMGTERDPIRALAERGILHVNPDQLNESIRKDTILQPNFKYEPALGHSSKTNLASNWERASDLRIEKDLASFLKKYPSLFKYNTWLEKVDPNTEVNRLHNGIHKSLGFDHLIDELHNSVNPESGLPNHLQLNPESLSRMSVPQAVQHVHNINEWRKDNRAEANKKLAFNSATFLHKDYPNSDYAWYQIRHPDMTDEERFYQQERFLENHYIDEDNYPQSFKDKRKALDEALKYEGDTMGHCVGGYSDEVADGKSNIYSLRNKKTGEPHVTVEVNPSEQEHYYIEAPPDIAQIKGKGNKKPVDRYLPYVHDFVKSGNWGEVDDLQNTGLRRMDELYYGLTDSMRKAGEEIPRFMTEEEFQAAEKRHFPHAATGGYIAKAYGGSIDPQKAIRRALMVARQTRLAV